ncbi:MAG: PKD domain-containing protein [Mariniblastus sp.]|nr:PKD domain-containing protein [Mariniblastus sp.]
MKLHHLGTLLVFYSLLALPHRAAADTYSDAATWVAALCENSTLVVEPYTLDIPDNSVGNPVDTPLTTSWGSFSTPGGNNGVDTNGDEGLAVSNSGADLQIIGQTGTFTGIGICYSGNDLTIRCTLADGSVETLTAPATAGLTTSAFFGWTNDTGQDVVDVELQAEPGNTNFILCTDMAFGTPANNAAPVADAGENQSTNVGSTVTLDGSDSCDDNTETADLVFAWSFISTPCGSSATLNDSTSATPTFVADKNGTFILELVVTDECGLDSPPAWVSISTNNLAPTAVPTVDYSLPVIGSTVNFSGLDSFDPDGDALTYSWEITSSPAGSCAELSGAETACPTLVPDVEGAYVISLQVSDPYGPSAAVEIEITATLAIEYAELLILEASDIVRSLKKHQIAKKGNRKKFVKELAKAIKEIQKGHYYHAVKALNKVIKRTDGCALRGRPDRCGKSRDWIKDCDAQLEVYDLLTQAKYLLQN